jgi:hypothetical protein
MTVFNKVKWVLGILLVFVLILTTNLIDKNNFEKVRDSVKTLYEDRIVAKDLLFELSNAIQEKQLAIAIHDSAFYFKRNKDVNIKIESSIVRFENTKLTRKENKVFSDLKANLKILTDLENSFISSNFANKKTVALHIEVVNENLYDLFQIQLVEGQKQIAISKRAIETVDLFTKIEIYLLIFLGIIISIIVIYNPKNDEKED